MRFLGNKESLMPEIKLLLNKKGLLNKRLKLYDAFCGSGAVSNSLKDSFEIVAGDLLNWCVVYTRGRLQAAKCKFKALGFNPFDYLNQTKTIEKGFFYNNYSEGNSNRKYFSPENAGRIDFFRNEIENWYNLKKINNDEYSYLLASLIESVSSVSNTAGVYGAFLKKWDARALKPIVFNSVNYEESSIFNHQCFTGRAEEFVDSVDCDVIYIDPPYTQNQYGTQYHILETLILQDEPSLSKITGSRPVTPMKSDWSKEYKVHVLFDRLISQTKAKHIVFSYSSSGILSKEFVSASMKRYGKEETFECIKIPYKKYRNHKTKADEEHFEYLFYVEKKHAEDVIYESPLNYIGSKSLIIPDIKNILPANIGKFIDVFGGGFNVGANINAKSIVYNDLNHFAKQLTESFAIYDTAEYLQYINSTIKKFDLSIANQDSYKKARNYYNSLPVENRDIKMLFVIIMYGFQQQIRFNSNYEFNNPVGMRWMNDKVIEKLVSFSRVLKEKNIVFSTCNFSDYDRIDENSFVYMDPPYRLTTGSYNDGKRGFKGWTLQHEKELREFADNLDSKGIKFMISYVLEHGGKHNDEVVRWCLEKGYKIVKVDDVPRRRPRKEVLILNYA